MFAFELNDIAERFFTLKWRRRVTRQMSFSCFSSNQGVVDQFVDHNVLMV
jgi:hypothetical protein